MAKKTKKKTTKKKASKKAKAGGLQTYLVTYHSPPSAMKKMMTASKEEMASGMAAWNKWGAKCGEHLVDFGAPLWQGINIKASGGAIPSKRKITGYSIMQAPNMAAIKKLMKGHPHLSWSKGCEIEVHEAMKMG